MNHFQVWVTGNVATAVQHVVTSSGMTLAHFRLACTPRRFDRQQSAWVDGSTSFVKVTCYRSLADNVTASLSVGDPVVVAGRLQVEENVRDERSYRDTVVVALAVGPDLTRGTAVFRRTGGSRVESGRGPEPDPVGEPASAQPPSVGWPTPARPGEPHAA
jgi:single-strand DNA-binding protein